MISRAVILGALLPNVAIAQGTRVDDAALVRGIEAFIAPLATRELSGTLLVARGSRIVYEKSFGFANHELGVPFTATTPTNVASLTKPLTIIITSRLAEARKLSVNDTVAKWLPEYVHGSKMTIAQLLNHSAGVAHRVLPSDPIEPKTTAEMVAAANASPLLFQPGERSVYSSGGFAILAAVLERVAGKSYDELLQEHVASPVGAHVIRHTSRRSFLPGRASAVIPVGESVMNAAPTDLSYLVGGGSVFTTPRDLFAVMNGLVEGAYGMAARVALVRNNGMHWNGVTSGYRAFADWQPTDSLTVILAANSHTGALDLLRNAIPRIAAGERLDPPAVPTFRGVPLTAAARSRLEGLYDTGGGSVQTVRFASPSLALFGDRALIAMDDFTFVSTADYARVVFAAGAAGAVSEIRWGAGTWTTTGADGPRFARKP